MPTYANWQDNPFQYALEDWTTSTPEGDAPAVSYGPGWAPELLDLRQKVESGQLLIDRTDVSRLSEAALARFR